MQASCIENIFNQLFESSHQTRLIGGAEEPYYRSSSNVNGSTIHYSHDYAASALHEVAHWCIAGAARRQVDDYDYWYDNERNESKQARFEAVETRPQALEWIFSRAAGIQFRVSIDNLLLPGYESLCFRKSVQQAVVEELQTGLGLRAAKFADALSRKSNTHSYDKLEFYSMLPE